MSKLEVNGITLTFPAEAGASGWRRRFRPNRKREVSPPPVLKNLTLQVEDGEFVSVIGPSGSGKSTLFHIIGGVLQPDSGTVHMDGVDVTGRRGLISYMPQNNTLLPWRTVLQNILLVQEVEGTIHAGAKAEAMEGLRRIGLEAYADAYPHVLSGGMQQRAAFLRALLSPQELLCLDEPFGALDALTREEMQHWLLSMWEGSGRSVLFVTHSIEEALLLSDRIFILSSKPAAVIREIQVPFARPRTDAVKLLPEFTELRRTIYELLKPDRQPDGTSS
ncbi:ABC transporter ATP-binding protein [Paenibacillus gansuensis]|uniref:ABC transporter ATP-binding protein n=1 Tax=Paenibacillus gansuensis TaxID=306542 RepID=A0ABW5PDW9_9BACL